MVSWRKSIVSNSNAINVTQDEIEGMIARLERRREIRDLPRYNRELTIEIIALKLLREMVALVDEEEKPDARVE